MTKRLEIDALECPDRAYCITATMVRMMGAFEDDQDDADWFQVAIYMLLTGGRPIEVLGDDKKSASDPRRADWRHTSWHARNGEFVDPFHQDMCYMLMGLQRKGIACRSRLFRYSELASQAFAPRGRWAHDGTTKVNRTPALSLA